MVVGTGGVQITGFPENCARGSRSQYLSMMSLSTKNADVDPSIDVGQTASHVCSKPTLNGSSAISDFLAMCTVCNLQTVQVVLDLFRTLEGG